MAFHGTVKRYFFTVDGEKLNAWQTCIKYCNKLAEVGYRLEDDYSYNFSVHNENSNEKHIHHSVG